VSTVSPVSPQSTATETTPAPVMDAESAQARWQRSGPDDYTFTVRYSCFCATYGAWRVDVEDGKVVGTRPLLDERPAGSRPNESRRPVDELLADAVRAEAGEAATIDAEYDPDTGVPTRVSIDWIANAIDDEISWEITAFRAR
jgi:hypothetical protein